MTQSQIEEAGSGSQLFHNHFLVSLSRLAGDYFQNTVTLIVEHTANGAFGLVINRPLDATLNNLIEELPEDSSAEVLGGGPVEQTRLFFLHSSEKSYPDSLDTGLGILLSSSGALIEDIKNRQGPKNILAVLGYAGWGPGQLENELIEDAWLITPATREILFETPHKEKATKAASQLGIDLNLYPSTTPSS
jgi:putative transcriptional regulator